jgi:hypothetical protein
MEGKESYEERAAEIAGKIVAAAVAGQHPGTNLSSAKKRGAATAAYYEVIYDSVFELMLQRAPDK